MGFKEYWFSDIKNSIFMLLSTSTIDIIWDVISTSITTCIKHDRKEEECTVLNCTIVQMSENSHQEENDRKGKPSVKSLIWMRCKGCTNKVRDYNFNAFYKRQCSIYCVTDNQSEGSMSRKQRCKILYINIYDIL